VRRAIGLALALALVVTACGGSDHKPSAASSASSSASPSSAATSPPSLQSALLTAADLPAGYVVVPASTQGAGVSESCPGHDPSAEVKEADKADATFRQPNGGSFVYESVARYDSADAAQRYLAAARDATAACRTSQGSNANQQITITPEPFDTLGDETFATRLGGSSSGLPVSGEVVFVRSGEYVMAVGNLLVGNGTADSKATAAIVKTAHDRLDAAT